MLAPVCLRVVAGNCRNSETWAITSALVNRSRTILLDCVRRSNRRSPSPFNQLFADVGNHTSQPAFCANNMAQINNHKCIGGQPVLRCRIDTNEGDGHAHLLDPWRLC